MGTEEMNKSDLAPDPVELGEMLRHRRAEVSLTLQQLSDLTGISASHIGRVERGNRFPSAKVLRRLACHLKFEENELFTLAGFLTQNDNGNDKAPPGLDPYVARILAKEPARVQRALISFLETAKNLARDFKNQR